MIDLTGANLIAYLRRIIDDVANRNPRFRAAVGDVKHQFNNEIQYKDVQVVIKDVTTSGTRLSPDYFMCTQRGRAILAKVDNKDAFIEWVQETDPTRLTPEAGVYYLNVNKVDEENNNLLIDVHKFRWLEGKLTNAQGSVLKVSPVFDPATLTLRDMVNNTTLRPDIDYEAFKGYINLKAPVARLEIPGLTPLKDYWYERSQSYVLIQSTIFGTQAATLPAGAISFKLVDQDGYELREGFDYTRLPNNRVQLCAWTPKGSTITAQVTSKLDPTKNSGVHPENTFTLNLGPNETLVPSQVFIHTQDGNYNALSADENGNITLPTCLQPGQWARWEVRVDAGQTLDIPAKKYDLNGNVIPGLYLAIGDNVSEGDQTAIIVSPEVTDTYQVYGSKENLNFTLEVRSNDLQTSSDLSEALKQQLLVMRRENMEADGITIFEASRSGPQAQARDSSGTATTFVYTVTVSAAADWKMFLPMVTRMTNYEIIDSPYIPDFLGKLQVASNGSLTPRMQAFGTMQFLTSYH